MENHHPIAPWQLIRARGPQSLGAGTLLEPPRASAQSLSDSIPEITHLVRSLSQRIPWIKNR